MTNRKLQIALLVATVVAVLLMTVGGKRRSAKRISAQTIPATLTFPQGFLWARPPQQNSLNPPKRVTGLR